MSNAAQKLPEGARPLKRAGGTNTVTTYARLRELTEAETAKGNVMALTAGKKITGVLVKSYVDEMYGKTNYVISQGDGSEIVVPGSGNLNTRMSEVAPGSYVEITYKGKSEIKSGKYKGKSAHTFIVDYEAV